jgi:hypothetical protein
VWYRVVVVFTFLSFLSFLSFHSTMSRKVAIAIDFSHEGDYACEWALDNFFKAGDVLHVIHCDEDPIFSGVSFDPSSGEQLGGLEPGLEPESSLEKSAKMLEGFAFKLEERKVSSLFISLSLYSFPNEYTGCLGSFCGAPAARQLETTALGNH